MAFDVYPSPQTAPLSLAATTSSALIPFTERRAPDPETNLDLMVIRLVKLGTAPCVPPTGLAPEIRLKADTGDAALLTTGMTTVIRNQPGAAGDEVANARLDVEPDGVYRVRVFVFGGTAGIPAVGAWQIQLRNPDADPRRFTWVVADTDADSRQPWIDVPTATTFDVLTGQTAPRQLQVANLGTGPLTVSDAVGSSPAAGFTVTAVPPAINPNACADVELSFAGGTAPGQTAGGLTYTVGSNDTTAQTVAGHNRRVALSATTRAVEIMLLLDASGSMGAKPDGGTAIAATDSRWSKMITAANQFLDLIAAFGISSGRFGVARFPDPAGCPTSQDIRTATEITLANVNATKIALSTNVKGNRTPMGHGIGRVIGTTPTSFGYFQSSAAAQQFNRRWLVLMSDGDENCTPPLASSFNGSYPLKKVSVISVGFGDPGASVYAPNHALLTSIATASPNGRFLDAGADDAGLGLAKAFRAAVTQGLTLDPTTDPIVTLTAGQREIRRAVQISAFESKAAFVVNWGTSDPGRVRVEVITPNCELITPAVAQADPNIELATDNRYRIYSFDADYLSNRADPTRPRYGEWTLIASADGLTAGQQEKIDYEVIFQSRLKMDLDFSRVSYDAGDPIVLAATLTVDGQPLRNADVTARLEAPGQFAGNWLARSNVTAGELKAARAKLTADANGLTAKVLALRDKGQVFTKASQVRTIRLEDPDGVGVYRATVPETSTPGTYAFYVTATGTTPDGTSTYRREKRVTTLVTVRPDPDFTIWDVLYRVVTIGGRRVLVGDVRVFPRDRFGNVVLIDPRVTTSLGLTVSGAEFVKPMVGNLDGSYTRRLQFVGEEVPQVALTLDDEPVVRGRAIPAVGQYVFADSVLEFRPGRDSERFNKHVDSKRVLGPIAEKGRNDFVSLGAFGSLAVGVKERLIAGRAADDILVVVSPDEELRPYRVEALATKERWVSIGDSPGVTQTFSLRKAGLKTTTAIRVVDKSGRTRAGDLRQTATPGVSVVGVGFRKTAAPPTPTTAAEE